MKNASHQNKNSFVKQASILAAAGILVRVIGFFYRLPLTGMIGDEGNGIYSVGYNFYNFFLILSSAGLPVAISKMVSERTALGEYRAARKVFHVSMAVAMAAGLLCAVILGFGAGGFAAAANSERSYYTLVSLAPTVFVVAVMAVLRGYFQGQGNAVPTAASQVAEQLFNAAFSLIMAYWFMQIALGDPFGDRFALGAAGATTGTGIGAVAGLFLLIWIYLLAKPGMDKKVKNDRSKPRSESSRRIAAALVKTALPIIAGTAIFSVSTLIDTAMVKSRLSEGNFFFPARVDELFGILSLKYVAMSTLPVSVSTAMATAAIPSVVASLTLRDQAAVNEKINAALRLTMILSVPAAVGMGVLADPIIRMLFPNNPEGALLLQVGSVSIIFLALAQIVTGMLQAVGKLHVPVIGAALGALIKIPLNYFLVGLPEINILGAVLSTIFCYVLASLFDWYALTRAIRIQPDLTAIFVKPLLCSAIMGLGCYVSYSLLRYLTGSNVVAVVFAVLIGVTVYFAYMILLRGIREEDLRRLPMGGKLGAVLRRRGARK